MTGLNKSESLFSKDKNQKQHYKLVENHFSPFFSYTFALVQDDGA